MAKARTKYVYPAAANELLTRQRMPDADMLTAEIRTQMADDVRLLRNAIGASLAGEALRARPTPDPVARSLAYGEGHEAADRLLQDWFLENPHVAGPLPMFLPTFEMADRALLSVLSAPDDRGRRVARYERMDTARRRAYGIPDGYLTRETLDLLAWTVGLPPGYLLLQLRVDAVHAGGTWQDAPIRPWLRDAIRFSLRRLGVEPAPDPVFGPDAGPMPGTSEEITVCARPPRVDDKGRELSPDQLRALDAVTRIKKIDLQLGAPGTIFTVLGGPEGFEARFGYRETTSGRVPQFSHKTMHDYLRRAFAGKDPDILIKEHRLPGKRNTARLNELIALLEPLMPEDGIACTAEQVASITALIAKGRTAQQTLFDDTTGKNTGTDDDDPAGPTGLN